MTSTFKILKFQIAPNGSSTVCYEYFNDSDDRVEVTVKIDEEPHPDLVSIIESFNATVIDVMGLKSSWEHAIVTGVFLQHDVGDIAAAFALEVEADLKLKVRTPKIPAESLDQAALRLMHQEMLAYVEGEKRAVEQFSLLDESFSSSNRVSTSTVSKARI